MKILLINLKSQFSFLMAPAYGKQFRVIVENDTSLYFHKESGALKTDKKVRNEHNLQFPGRLVLIFTSASGVWVG